MQKKIRNAKRLSLILTLLFAFKVNAQSCDGIADGAVVRLDEPGKSLHKARTQDQDGLGTCYANAAAVLLQSRLEGNPEVSYLNLAFMYAEKHNSPAVRQNGEDSGLHKKKDPTESDSFLIDGGFTCDTINTAKERGGVCARSDVALESMFHSANSPIAQDSSWIQKDLLQKLTKYYDGVFHEFKRKKKEQPSLLSFLAPKQSDKDNRFTEYKAALKDVLSRRKDEYSKAKCLEPDTTQSEQVVKNMLARFYQYTNNPANSKSKQFPQIAAMGRKFGVAVKMMTSSGYGIDITVHDHVLKTLKDDYISRLKSNPSANVEETLIKSLQKIEPKFNEKVLNTIGGFSNEDKVHMAVDYDRYALKDVDSCKQMLKLDYLINDDGLLNDFKNDSCLARYGSHAENIRELVKTLDKANLKNIDSLYSFLMDLPDMNYEQAMMRMVGPDCPDNKKIKLPDDLQCDSQGIHYSGEPSAENDLAFLNQTKSTLKNLAKTSIQSGNAVGLSICTGFWDPNKPDAFYNKTKECPTTTHGYHAVAMVGYRCKAGQMQYLIQNSWGDWASAKNRFADTEPGKAWISEEDLAKNTYRYDAIK